jgi:hypothetical protein
MNCCSALQSDSRGRSSRADSGKTKKAQRRARTETSASLCLQLVDPKSGSLRLRPPADRKPPDKNLYRPSAPEAEGKMHSKNERQLSPRPGRTRSGEGRPVHSPPLCPGWFRANPVSSDRIEAINPPGGSGHQSAFRPLPFSPAEILQRSEKGETPRHAEPGESRAAAASPFGFFWAVWPAGRSHGAAPGPPFACSVRAGGPALAPLVQAAGPAAAPAGGRR